MKLILNGEEVSMAALRLKQTFELLPVPAGLDEYTVTVNGDLPWFVTFDGVAFRGRVESLWNQE